MRSITVIHDDPISLDDLASNVGLRLVARSRPDRPSFVVLHGAYIETGGGCGRLAASFGPTVAQARASLVDWLNRSARFVVSPAGPHCREVVVRGRVTA